jgi:hypothetical protein
VRRTVEPMLVAGIVAVTLVFSVTLLRFAWTRRDALLAGTTT